MLPVISEDFSQEAWDISSREKYLSEDRFVWWKPHAGFDWINDARACFESSPGFARGRFLPRSKQKEPTGEALVILRDFDLESEPRPDKFVMSPSDYELYEPLKNTTLFTEFAELDYSHEVICEFANEHGWLGIHEFLRSDSWYYPERGMSKIVAILTQKRFVHLPRASSEQDVRDPVIFFGEWYIEWIHAIHEMKTTLQLWELLKQDSTRELGMYIVWKNDAVFYKYPPSEGLDTYLTLIGDRNRNVTRIAHKETPSGVFRKWRPYGYYEPARFLLKKILRRQLDHYVTPHLLLDETQTFKPSIVPHNLLGAMWLQFYRAITNETRLTRCDICKKWMDVTENNKNKRQHTECGNRERQRRRREKRAKRSV